MYERFLNFPKGIKQMYLHALRYKNIHDASRTPINAWTINHPILKYKQSNKTSIMSATAATVNEPNDDDEVQVEVEIPLSTKIKDMKNRFGFLIYGNERRPGRIPRRQHEQQRQTLQDYKQMGILIALYMPPIIGELPVILAALFPRQVLSRQFHNPYEIEAHAQMEYAQRKAAFLQLSDQFWSKVPYGTTPRTLVSLFQTTTSINDEDSIAGDEFDDPAGPMIDAIRLYTPFAAATTTNSSSTTPTSSGLSGSVYMLPKEYLVSSFSKSIGCMNV